jgi:hypothetical protein
MPVLDKNIAPYFKSEHKRTGSMAQVVQYLHRKDKALSSILSTAERERLAEREHNRVLEGHMGRI